MVESVATATNGADQVLTLDRAVSEKLGAAGFIAGDLTSSAGARYLIDGNVFADAADHGYLSGFFALDLMAEAANFPNSQDEVTGTTVPAPPINQNIIVANNLFETNSPQAVINVSSATNVLFFRDSIDLIGQNGPGPRQFPVTVHDASNVFLDETSAYSTSLSGTSCDDSIMLQLYSPPPVISPFEPIACEIEATTSGLDYRRP